MSTRIITAIVALFVLFPFLWFSETFMMLIFSGVLAEVALFEMLGCVGWRKNLWVAIPTYLTALAAVLMTRLVESDRYFTMLFAVFFSYIFVILCVSVFSRGAVDIMEVSIVIGTTIYIAFGFSSMILLRDLPNGQYIYLLAFITPWGCDTMAYFCGMFFGRHKLIPDVSPKKTVEGAIGGTVLGTGLVVFYGWLMSCLYPIAPNYLGLILVGLVSTVVSQFGDLIASKIKRHYGIKDYGVVFPGHGGVMDRFDSAIAVSAFLYMLCAGPGVFQIFS